MKLEKVLRNWYEKYREKGAISGHSVDRYQYAVFLIKKGGEKNLIKAYAWLSLAADEIDQERESGRLKHQLSFVLKEKNLFDQALIIEHTRHRSPINFLVNLVSGLAGYCLKPRKPSIGRNKFWMNPQAFIHN